jgi:hypothetical protein
VSVFPVTAQPKGKTEEPKFVSFARTSFTNPIRRRILCFVQSRYIFPSDTNDPKETNNIVNDYPEVVSDLKAILKKTG